MSNVLKAFINIVNNYQTVVNRLANGNNRANNMGEGLEEYIKNAFANTIQLICLMKKEKYESLPFQDRQMIEDLDDENVSVSDVRIKNPNNPIQLMDGKLLVFKIEG